MNIDWLMLKCYGNIVLRMVANWCKDRQLTWDAFQGHLDAALNAPGANAEAAAADLGVGFGFVLLTLASLVHRVILVVKLERQRRIAAIRDAERAAYRQGILQAWQAEYESQNIFTCAENLLG